MNRLDEIGQEIERLGRGGGGRRGAVLTAQEAADELRCSVDHLRKYYVQKKLLRPLPRKSAQAEKGKRGGGLKFLAEEVARLKGISL